MRRALPAIGLTLMGTALVLRFQTVAPSDVAASGPVGTTAGTTTSPSTTTSAATDPAAATTDTGTTDTGTTDTGTSDGSLVDGTYVGDSVGTQFGDVQVQIEVQDGQITAVEGLAYPWSDHHSQEINSWAIPQYTSEVVTAQSSDIDAMSGATITWQAFVLSVESAIEQAAS